MDALPMGGMPRTDDQREGSLAGVIPLLRKWLRQDELGRLRGCCREARVAVDCGLDYLRFCDGTHYMPNELPSGAAAGVQGMVSRGCRLHALSLKLARTSEANPDASIAFGLSLLAELAVKPSLTELTLQGLPLTAEVVRAIAAAAPRPRKLVLWSYGHPQHNGSPAGVRDLLRHAAPHLQQLELDWASQLGTPLAAPTALAAAPGGNLASLLQQCSRLESLELFEWRAAAEGPGVLRALAQLPALRSLMLVESFDGGPTSCYLSALSSLSRLTHLRTMAHVDVLLPGLASMHNLIELDLVFSVLQATQLGQLTALTALTSLIFGNLMLAPADPAPLVGGGGVADGPAPGLPLGRARLVQLPPHLQCVSLGEELIGTDVMAALQLPPSLAWRYLRGLVLPAGALDEGDVLRPAAAEAVLVACRQLAGRLLSRNDQRFHLDLGRAKAPATWGGLYGPLFAALRPLALRKLHLRCPPLTVRDVDSLVQQLPTLQALELQGGLDAAALPLLHRLGHLRYLHVDFKTLRAHEDLAEGWANKAALRAVLLALCMQAPSLKTITLDYSGVLPGPLQAAAVAAQVWLAETLPHVCSRPPPVVNIQAFDP